MSLMSCKACGGLYDTDEGAGFYIEDENCAEYELPYVLCDTCRDEMQESALGKDMKCLLEQQFKTPVKLITPSGAREFDL